MNYQKQFHENLKKQLFNACKFFNQYIDQFTLLVRKGAYP